MMVLAMSAPGLLYAERPVLTASASAFREGAIADALLRPPRLIA
jgi:hypothetical protein